MKLNNLEKFREKLDRQVWLTEAMRSISVRVRWMRSLSKAQSALTWSSGTGVTPASASTLCRGTI